MIWKKEVRVHVYVNLYGNHFWCLGDGIFLLAEDINFFYIFLEYLIICKAVLGKISALEHSLWGTGSISWALSCLNRIIELSFLVSSDLWMRPAEWNCYFSFFFFLFFSLMISWLFLKTVYISVHESCWEPVLLCLAQGYFGSKRERTGTQTEIRTRYRDKMLRFSFTFVVQNP